MHNYCNWRQTEFMSTPSQMIVFTIKSSVFIIIHIPLHAVTVSLLTIKLEEKNSYLFKKNIIVTQWQYIDKVYIYLLKTLSIKNKTYCYNHFMKRGENKLFQLYVQASATVLIPTDLHRYKNVKYLYLNFCSFLTLSFVTFIYFCMLFPGTILLHLQLFSELYLGYAKI